MEASNENLEESDESNLIENELPEDIRFFKFGAVRFIWSRENGKFERQTALDHGYSINDIQDCFNNAEKLPPKIIFN